MSNDGIFDEIQFYTAESCPYGLTYGQWTVKWWRWFLSTPKSMNPVIDESGKFAFVNQPPEHVWFLAGKVGDEHKSIPKRFCKIPASRSILLPVINCEVNPLEHPELSTDHDLIERVNADENTIILKECVVDGKLVPVQRVKSDPEIFEVEISEDNAYSIEGGGITSSAADGYWVFLRPLPVGKHNISFRGSCEKGKLNSGANYDLKIE
jgi:hypothetical protein